MPQSAAAVVDLNEFRRRREARSAPRPMAPSQAAPVAVPVPAPVWIMWVPVWVVA
jgi:hypothetical protein